MTPFSHPKYHDHEKKAGKLPPCAYCGKGVKNDDAPQARALDGGGRFAMTKEEAHDSANDSDPGDMGWWPVGPDCARKLKKAGVYMTAKGERPAIPW